MPIAKTKTSGKNMVTQPNIFNEPVPSGFMLYSINRRSGTKAKSIEKSAEILRARNIQPKVYAKNLFEETIRSL